MPSIWRLFLIICLAIAEATPAALLLTALGATGTWGVLCLATLIGAFADLLVRRAPAIWQRPALLLMALIVALIAVDLATTEPAGAVGVLLNGAHPESGRSYLVLLGSLYAFWRGGELGAHDTHTLRDWYARAGAAALVFILLGLLLGIGHRPGTIDEMSMQVIGLFATGLTSIALTGIAEASGGQLRRVGARGLATISGAVAGVVLLGVVLVSLLGGEISAALGGVWLAIVTLLELMLAPIFYILVVAIDWFLRRIGSEAFAELLITLQIEQQERTERVGGTLSFLPDWLIIAAQIAIALIPVGFLIALILALRRRPRQGPAGDETRESLFSFETLIGDLRDLLAGRRHANQSLVAALAALHGTDPSSRVRRAYIRFLIRAERGGRMRLPRETPRDFAAALPAATPEAAAAIADL
ncbi:MAG TPA: hypothetical protein PKC19_19335, partial [Roseiflexaceae bacterium]|nr:hypothetical protein [Roseiflexaceae bacterium]